MPEIDAETLAEWRKDASYYVHMLGRAQAALEYRIHALVALVDEQRAEIERLHPLALMAQHLSGQENYPGTTAYDLLMRAEKAEAERDEAWAKHAALRQAVSDLRGECSIYESVMGKKVVKVARIREQLDALLATGTDEIEREQ